jgi:hypothetical protein
MLLIGQQLTEMMVIFIYHTVGLNPKKSCSPMLQQDQIWKYFGEKIHSIGKSSSMGWLKDLRAFVNMPRSLPKLHGLYQTVTLIQRENSMLLNYKNTLRYKKQWRN